MDCQQQRLSHLPGDRGVVPVDVVHVQLEDHHGPAQPGGVSLLLLERVTPPGLCQRATVPPNLGRRRDGYSPDILSPSLLKHLVLACRDVIAVASPSPFSRRFSDESKMTFSPAA